MSQLLSGKTALITGASSGIGLAMARLFVEEGASVAITGRNEEKLRLARNELSGYDTDVIAVEGDVSMPDVPGKTLDHVISEFGSLDILVNNAGHGSGQLSIEATEDAFYDAVLGANLRAPFIFSREYLKYAMKRDSGTIINVASVNGVRPLTGTAYCASKSGLIALTKNIALRFTGTGIRANVLCPGPTDTPMAEVAKETHMGIADGSMHEIVNSHSDRTVPCSAEDIAKAALFFASDLSSGCNGAVLVVDKGGYL